MKYLKYFIPVVEAIVIFNFYSFIIRHFTNQSTPFVLLSLITLFIIIGIGNLYNATQFLKDIQLLKKCLSFKSLSDLIDDTKVIICGKIISINHQSILSPFTLKPTVFYSYRIFRIASNSSDYDYYGCSFTPSIIQSNLGNISVKSYPVLEGFKENLYSYSSTPQILQIYANAIGYIQRTKFDAIGQNNIVDAIRLGKNLMLDRDGQIKQDTQYTQTAFDIRTRDISETYVLNNEDVCVVGIWKADQQDITSDYNRTVLKIIKGTPDIAINNIKALLLKSLCVGLVFLFAIHIVIIGGLFISSAAKLQDNNQDRVNRSTNYIIPTVPVTPTTSPTLMTYQSSIGNFSYQYPSNWINSEYINRNPDLPEQPVISMTTFVSNPIYASIFGSFSVDVEINHPDCKFLIPTDISSFSIRSVLIDGIKYDVYSKLELNISVNRKIFTEDIFISRSNHCYIIKILDQEHRPFQKTFQQILGSFSFLDSSSPTSTATTSATPTR